MVAMGVCVCVCVCVYWERGEATSTQAFHPRLRLNFLKTRKKPGFELRLGGRGKGQFKGMQTSLASLMKQLS